MPNSGCPTPDNFEGDAEFVCIPLIVPAKTEFAAAVYGLYGNMAKEWFWKQQGTMTPETAAALVAQAYAMTNAYGECGDMSCEDIADCIETDEGTQAAIASAITINELIQQAVIEQLGGLGDTNSVNATRTRIADRNMPSSLDEPVRDMIECNLDGLWSGIREIVERLDDIARDMLEDLAALNDLPQRYQAFIDVVPIVGDVAEGIATAATELIPDILNAYNSYSSEEELDEIACDLFSLVCAECRYPTYKEILDYYAGLGYEMSDMDAMTTALMVSNLVGMMGGSPPPQLVYFSTVTFALFALYLQATFNGISGTVAISRFAKLGEDLANNNWQELCETCGQTYRIMVWDFTAGQQDWYVDGADGNPDEGVYNAGKGWRTVNNRVEIAVLADPTWIMRSCGFLTSGGTVTARNMALRPTIGSTTGQAVQGLSNGTGEYNHCQTTMTAGLDGFNEIALHIQGSGASVMTWVEKAFMIFEAANAPQQSIPTPDGTECT